MKIKNSSPSTQEHVGTCFEAAHQCLFSLVNNVGRYRMNKITVALEFPPVRGERVEKVRVHPGFSETGTRSLFQNTACQENPAYGQTKSFSRANKLSISK